jgi:type IV pilus assembly protein PilE
MTSGHRDGLAASRQHPLQPGFTLMELMIVLVVLAILATIAVASYQGYVLRAGRAEAISTLVELAQLQEEYFGNRQSYASALSTLNHPATTTGNRYRIELTVSPTVGYTLEATAINAQLRDDACRVFRLNASGNRIARDQSDNDTTITCWER